MTKKDMKWELETLALHTAWFENIFKRMTMSKGCAFGPS